MEWSVMQRTITTKSFLFFVFFLSLFQNTLTDDLQSNSWKFSPNASKIYSDETCFRELAQYPAVPKITVDIGKDYDVKSLNVFKDIGDLFLELVTRNSLYDTVKLVRDLSPINTTGKLLQLIEFQLIVFIVLFIGTATATLTLVVIVLFWMLKLTGSIKEVEYQKMSDSKGPKRFLLSVLTVGFTILILLGCNISWVGNTHISNNLNEVNKHVKWTVNTTDYYMEHVKEQMKTMFIEQYEDIYLGILEKGINDAIHNASALVFLAIEANGTQTFNTSTFLYNSITNRQRSSMNRLEYLYDFLASKTEFFLYLDQIKAARECIVTIDEWCDTNEGSCNPDKNIPQSYLESLDPDEMYYDNVLNASQDASNLVDNSGMSTSVMQAFYNGIYFHNGSLANATYVATCIKTDISTGIVLITKDPPEQGRGESGLADDVVDTRVSESVTCYGREGCLFDDSLTKLLSGVCCLNTEIIMNKLDEVDEGDPPDLTLCGPDEYKINDVVQEGGAQSHYTGNMTTTVTGKECISWGDVVKVPGDEEDIHWDKWAEEKGYLGLLSTTEGETEKNNFCRNPSPKIGVYGTEVAADVKSRAWCFTSTTEGAWEYCNVPFCPDDSRAALKALEDDPTSFIYPTCNDVPQVMYPGLTPLSSQDFTMWVTSEKTRLVVRETLEEASREIIAQFDIIRKNFEDTNYEFEELKNSILSNLGDSNASKIRKDATAIITGLCLLTVCVCMTGMCIGYCNIGGDIPPHLRSTGCSSGGSLIKMSSNLGALLAVINLLSATIYFIPGSVLSLICTDYANDDLFKLLDDKVLVDYSVLGRAVLGDDSYDAMTLKKFLLDCREDRTLWQSLSLSDDPKYNFKNLLNLNETLMINETFSNLLKGESVDFSNYPPYPDNLRTWLKFWTDSNATTIPWDTLKNNLRTPFLSVSYDKIDSENTTDNLLINNQYFCNAFYYFGIQVTDRSGPAYQCREKFRTSLRSECLKWVKDYKLISEGPNSYIGLMSQSVDIIEEEWRQYDVDSLIEQYEWTNTNLLNLNGSDFSWKIINETYISFWQPLLNNEMNCLSWQFNYTMDKDLATCYPVSHVIDTTMGYFCQYGVTSVTLCWVSQGLLGFVLTLFVLVSRKLAAYFIKLDKRHPDDIPNEERIAAFQQTKL